MPQFVLVAHGSPSDPEPPQAELARIAAAVAPGTGVVRAATLAMPGALAAALAGLDTPVIYPFLMSEGWFTRTELPRRLAELGVQAPVLRPFGADAAMCALALAAVPVDRREVIVAAHGSRRPGAARETALNLVDQLRATGRFDHVVPAFIEEPPFIADVAAAHPEAACLPFFALRAGHVMDDIPAGLNQAGFRGALLPAIGEMAEVPQVIARALRAI